MDDRLHRPNRAAAQDSSFLESDTSAAAAPGKSSGVSLLGEITPGRISAAAEKARGALARVRDVHLPQLRAASAASRTLDVFDRLAVRTSLRELEESIRHAGGPDRLPELVRERDPIREEAIHML